MTDATPSSAPVTTPAAPRRRLKILLAGSGLVALAALAGVFALSRFLDPDSLARWLEPRIEAAVNRDVSVGRVEVGMFPLGIRLREVTVSDPTGLEDRLAYLEALEFRVRILPLLKREVRVREIHLDGLEANLAVAPDSTTNFGDFSPAEEATSGPGGEEDAPRPFALQLDGIRVTGSLGYRDLRDSLSLRVSGVNARAAVLHEVGGPWRFDALVDGSLSLSGSLPSQESLPSLESVPLGLQLVVEADDDFEAIRIGEGSLSVEAVRLGITGEASRLKEPVRQLRVALTADGVRLPDVLALLPDSLLRARELSASGTLAADLSVEGPLGPDSVPVVKGVVSVADGGLRMGSMSLLEGVQASVDVQEDRSVRPQIRGRLLAGVLAVDGVVRLEGGATPLDLRVQMNPDLSLVDGGLLPEGTTLSGRLPADLRVAGNAAEPTGLGIWGEVGVVDLHLTHPGLGVPASVARAALTLEGSRASLQATEVVLGNDRVELGGTLLGLTAGLDGGTPEFRGTARGSRISLVELVAEPPPDTALTYGRIAFAKVGGRRVRGIDADEAARVMGLKRPTRIPLAGEVQVHLDTLIDRKGRMEELDATVVFGPEFLQVTRSSFQRYGGRIEASGGLQVGADPEEPFSLRLVVEGVDAGAFLGETTPLGRAVTGRLDMDLDLAGALDALLLPSRSTLQGAGSFSLTGGGLNPGALGERLAGFVGIPALSAPRIRDWSTAFVLRDGRVLLDEATLDGAPGTPRVGGGVGLNGALDLVTAFDLPREQLASDALQRLGVPQAAGGLDVVAAILRVGGTLSDPELRADPRASVAAVTETVQEQVRTEVDRQIEERKTELQDRATGFIRGLLGRRDTARTAPPPDTVRVQPAVPDTTGRDTLRSDTTRPDTVKRDTLPPDTVRPDTTRPDTGSARPSGGSGGTPGR